MRIENHSAYHPTSRLLPIIDFVSSHTQYSTLATLQLFDLKDLRKFTGGFAQKHAMVGNGSLALVAPSLISIQLSHGASYPASSLHVRAVGRIEVQNFEEEFLFVLSHEAFHIDQGWGHGPMTSAQAELGAELFAVEVLKDWRGGSVDLSKVPNPTCRVPVLHTGGAPAAPENSRSYHGHTRSGPRIRRDDCNIRTGPSLAGED